MENKPLYTNLLFKYRAFTNLLLSLLSIIPIISVVPTYKDEFRILDFPNYVILMNQDWRGYGVMFRHILLLISKLFGIEGFYEQILFLRYFRFFLVVLLNYLIIDLIFRSDIIQNQTKIILSIALVLSYPERFLFYLFRIRFLFSFLIMIISIHLIIYQKRTFFNNSKNNKSNKKQIGLWCLCLGLALSSFAIHEAMIFPLLGTMLGIVIIRISKIINRELLENCLTILFYLTFLLFPILMINSIEILNNTIFANSNIKLGFENRGFLFNFYYYFILIVTMLLHISINWLDFSIEKMRSIKNHRILTNLVDNIKSKWILPLSILTLTLKIPLYLDSLVEIIFILAFWIMIMISKWGFRLDNYNSKILVILFSILYLTQFTSIQMQFWHLSALNVHLENQLDLIGNFFYFLIFAHIHVENPVKFTKTKINGSCQKFFDIRLPKLSDFNIAWIFLILVLLTPSFIVNKGEGYVPPVVTEDQDILDETALKILENINKYNNLNGYEFGDKVAKFQALITNSLPLSLRLKTLTGTDLTTHPTDSKRKLNDFEWMRQRINKTGGIWVAEMNNITFYEDLSKYTFYFTFEVIQINQYCNLSLVKTIRV